MARFAAPVMAVLLVVAVVAAVPLATGAGDRTAGVATPPETPSGTSNSSARMVVPSPDRTGHGTVGPSLSAAASDRVQAVRNDHDGRALQRRFDSLDDRTAKINLLLSELVDLKQRARALVVSHQRATRLYVNGSLSESALLRRLADIHQEAVEIDRRGAVVEELTNRIDVSYLDESLQLVTGLTETVRSPVSGRVATALAAGEPLPTVSVEATADAVVVSMVDDGQYLREAMVFGNLNFGGEASITSFSEAVSRANELYPWSFANLAGSDVNVGPRVEMYQVRVPHQHGRLTTFLDVQSGNVVTEFQHLRLSAVPTRTARSVTEDGLRVVLNRTYRGGPLQVGVYDAETGAPVAANVTIGNRSVGGAAFDGTAWVVEPRSAYTLRVQTDDGSVTVGVGSSY